MNLVNRDIFYEDNPRITSIHMGSRTMHIYFDPFNGRHGFDIYDKGTKVYSSTPQWGSLVLATREGRKKLAQLGNNVIRVVTDEVVIAEKAK